MINIELWARTIGLFIIISITSFGPGVIIGVMFGNSVAARGKDTIGGRQAKAVQNAHEHNAQWHPSHERWKK